MIERGQDLRFALEAGEPVGVEGEQFGEDLQRDVAIELRVVRAIDLPHPARAQGRLNLVRAKARASGQGHEARLILVAQPLTAKEKGTPLNPSTGRIEYAADASCGDAHRDNAGRRRARSAVSTNARTSGASSRA